MFLGLLALIFVSGAAATRTLREMHQQEQNTRRLLADRAQQLSGLFISVEVYNQTIGRYVGHPGAKPDPFVRQELDRETTDLEFPAGSLSRRPPVSRKMPSCRRSTICTGAI